MRRGAVAGLAVIVAGLLAPARAGDKAKAEPEQKVVASGTASDEKVDIAAKAFLDKESMRQALGTDLGAGYLVVEVTVTPKGDEKLNLDLDDFLIRSDKDGQHSRPLTPTQVAGNAVMVVKSTGGQQGRMGGQGRIPIGGIPGGGYPGQYPGQYPGGYPSTGPMGGASGGSATADTSGASASINEKNAGKPNPLLDALKAKVLQEGEIDHPVTGLLYFQIDGKVKPKQLELVYRKAPPRVSVRFKDPNKK